MKLSESEIRERLDRWPVARLATIGESGRPHQVPIVFVRVGEHIWSPVDGKPKRGAELVRVANLSARPEASLLLDEYTEDWDRLWWLRLDVSARVVRGRESVSRAQEIAEVVEALGRKYPQYARWPVLRDPPTLLRFELRGTRSWCARALG